MDDLIDAAAVIGGCAIFVVLVPIALALGALVGYVALFGRLPW
jgi:hypothetical protein